MAYKVGVDIGGTFADFAVIDQAKAEILTLKVFSRPDMPGAEILDGLEQLRSRYGVTAELIDYISHGTTVGVNTVIQRRGARLALLTTKDFEDVLEVGRLKIPDMYDLLSKRPEPLISRDHVFGVRERLDAVGSEIEPVNAQSVQEAIEFIRQGAYEGVVLAFLHAYRNPSHEEEVANALRSVFPELSVVSTSEVWPIIREYERTITASISAYAQPRVRGYLDSVAGSLTARGVPVGLHVTKSNGGVMTADEGKRNCVQIILSGTAAGVMGAAQVAGQTELDRVMSLDIGGTSADVAIINDGIPQHGVGEQIGEFQIFVPSVSVTSIGDGGGSIAWVDPLGVLKVGPESAGSNPGPVCYGNGGTSPTITDAFLACNLIGHGGLGYQSIRLDVDAAKEAIGKLAETVTSSLEETAEAVIDVAVSGMYAEVGRLMSRYGADPRDYHLLAFGGAGPMLACFLARDLQTKGVVVPLTPGVLSALGGLTADIKNDFIATVYAVLEGSEVAQRLSDSYEQLERKALGWLHDGYGQNGGHRFIYSADMRYVGQSYEIETILEEQWIRDKDVRAIQGAFHLQHEALFGHSDAEATVQLINVRLVISREVEKPRLLEIPQATAPAEPDRIVSAWIDHAWQPTGIFRRSELRAKHHISGPAIVLQDDCTTCIPAGCELVVDRFGNLVIGFSKAWLASQPRE